MKESKEQNSEWSVEIFSLCPVRLPGIQGFPDSLWSSEQPLHPAVPPRWTVPQPECCQAPSKLITVQTMSRKPDPIHGWALPSARLPSLWLTDTFSVKQWEGEVGKKILFSLSPSCMDRPPLSHYLFISLLPKYHCSLSLALTHDFIF